MYGVVVDDAGVHGVINVAVGMIVDDDCSCVDVVCVVVVVAADVVDVVVGVVINSVCVGVRCDVGIHGGVGVVVIDIVVCYAIDIACVGVV